MSVANHADTDHDRGWVHSAPRRWLRLDGLTVLVAAIAFFATTGQPWWLLPIVIVLPDLFMLGYLRDSGVGASVYNLGHTYLLPAALCLAAAADHHPLLLAIGLLWLAHIGMDRTLGYGLKYTGGFAHTHLGRLAGPPRTERPADARPSTPSIAAGAKSNQAAPGAAESSSVDGNPDASRDRHLAPTATATTSRTEFQGECFRHNDHLSSGEQSQARTQPA
jgi:uncharacterized protein DUF4260